MAGVTFIYLGSAWFPKLVILYYSEAHKTVKLEDDAFENIFKNSFTSRLKP